MSRRSFSRFEPRVEFWGPMWESPPMDFSFEKAAEDGLAQLKQEGRHRDLKVSGANSFAHNDYLGLSGHPEIVAAGEKALREHGTGSRGSRLLGGHSEPFADAEARIADHFGAPSALFFSTGYLSNLAAITALGELAEVIVSDEKNHASLIDGIRLSGKPKQIVPHDAWREMAMPRRALVVAESLYSMDGDTVDWESLDRIAGGPGNFCYLDEAHAVGVLGPTGRGLAEGKIDWARTAVGITFGKAYGVQGGAILCSHAIREWIVNRARSFIYTTAPSPAVMAMAVAGMKVASRESWRRVELLDRAKWVRETLGNHVPAGVSPIIPFPATGNDTALRISENMRKLGHDLRAIRYPTVPRGEERIRISLSLSVSREATELMAKDLVKVWMEYSSQQ